MIGSGSKLCAFGDFFRNSLTLVDLTGADQPLVYVNRAFSEMTCYGQAEILGRNCRFLQGPGTAREDVARVREAIATKAAVFCDLLNYRKDGRAFYNRLVLLPIVLDDRPHMIGMQLDVTASVGAAAERGTPFDALKASDMIRDRINTPLMKILNALEHADSAVAAVILERSFTQIADAVSAQPFRA